MSVPGMLFKILEDLIDDDLKTFQWFLTLKPPVLDNCKRIAKSQVVNLSREDTVSRIIESYGEASAVNLTIEILRKMNMNDAAEKLKKTYAEGNTAATQTSPSASAPPTAPATISAQHGAVVIAPNITGSSTGSVNITINKS
ncbi:NACHT, LRR and PYD domains-containing protein 3-like [Anabas testudineus]|uniref:NACHT, LRR and PYD domains-containing protein 3-like n=1 Tax=Anabas testudineus TaxID=64144 RepID=UPI000E456E61|nr:NACHT, LRR and PYD domains-containing protein 3-like [Anabas testudineus]